MSPPFRPRRRLGHGAMAEVHLADLRLPGGGITQAAVKRVLPVLVQDKEVLLRFREEAELVQGLTHPNIVRVLKADVEGEDPWIAFEYLLGPNVQDLIDALDGRPAPEGLARAVGRMCAEGLAYAHHKVDASGRRTPVVHRDIAPQNLIFDGHGVLKIIDFGLARGGRRRRTMTGAILGHAGWLSPEQAVGEVADARSDVFSCALVVYVLATGHHPFLRDNEIEELRAVEKCRVPSPYKVGVEVSEGLVRVLVRALSKDPRDRYADGEQLAEAFHRLETQVEPWTPDDVSLWLAESGHTVLAAHASAEVTTPQPGPPLPPPPLGETTHTKATEMLPAARGTLTAGVVSSGETSSMETALLPDPGATRTAVISEPSDPSEKGHTRVERVPSSDETDIE